MLFVLERLLLSLLWITRIVFLLQALAFGAAAGAAFAAAGGNVPDWLQSAVTKGLLISGTFLAAGVLLVLARRWRVPSTTGVLEPTWPWPLVFGVSLLALPAVAAVAGSGLPSLWRRIGVHLSAVGFWEGVARPDPYGGIVLLPIMIALMVPLLLSAATAFSIALPLALLPLLSGRRRLFPTLLAMGVVCQVALVLTGWIAADVFARLATEAMAAMGNSGDAEVKRLGEELAWATGIMRRTALALAAPALGMLAWMLFLRPSGTAATYFALDESADAPEAYTARSVHAPAPPLPPPQSTVALPDLSPLRPLAGIVVVVARLGLGALGALMLLFGAAGALRSQPSWVASQPAPGVTLASGPRTLRVTLATRLDPGSSLSLIRLVTNPESGEFPRDVELVSRLAPDDAERRTLEATPTRTLSPGLYRVAWWARPTGGRSAHQGTFTFGVAVPVPNDTADEIHTVSERDAGARRRRHVTLGGVLLLVLSALVPWLATRR